MEYRNIEKLDVQASLLGFGCMRFPRLGDGRINERDAERLLDYAILNGVNYIDTAYVYHNGESEAFVGRVAKKYPRDKMLLATKMPMASVRSSEQAKDIFEEQRKRMQVEYFDFYLLHGLDAKKWKCALESGVLAYLEEMQAEGKIRFLGFSFHDAYAVFEEILKHRDWDFCQMQLNYMDTEHQQGMRGYALAEEMNVPVIIMEPVKGGSLAELPKDIINMFEDMAPEKSAASWALRWVSGLPQVKVVLSGMSDFSQVDDNLTTFSPFVPLSEQEKELVERVARMLKARAKNGCTGCGYCMPCPLGVNIPACFKRWNELAIYENHEKVKHSYYTLMVKEERADRCRGCGRCEKLCPQQLKIRRDLFSVVTDLAMGKLQK